MRFSIITSSGDIAGMNIKDRLIEKGFIKTNELFEKHTVYEYKHTKLYTTNQDTVFFETLENDIPSDYYIFATRHQSKSKEKTLSIHIPGNYNKAEFGGKENELCMSFPSMMKQAFINLNELGKDTDFSITLEATHHGPLIKKPVFFIEIGSSENEWIQQQPAEIIAKTIIKTLDEYKKKDYEIAIGFGGLHYCAAFNKIELNSNIALSHICPKYSIDSLDEEMVMKMINSTYGKVDYALIDWKGTNSEQRQKVIQILENLKIRWKKTKGL